MNKINSMKTAGFVAPLAFLLIIFFNIPITIMLIKSFSDPFPSLTYYIYLLKHSVYLQVMLNTFKIAVLITVLAIILGYPLAYWMTKLSKRWQMTVVTLVVLSFLVSVLVRAYAWIVLLGNNGIVNSLLLKLGIISEPLQMLYNNLGVNIGTLNLLLPFFILPLYFAMLQIDGTLLKAASSLGATQMNVFWKIYFPLTIRPLISSATLVFILTLGFFITPALLGGGKVSMIANVLDLLINSLSNWELASALSVVLLLVATLFYFLSRKVEVMK